MLDKFFASIGYNLSRIASPSGRESNILFWPYAVLVVALNYVAGSLIAAPIVTAMLENVVQIFEAASEGRGAPPVPFDPAFMPDMSSLVVPHSIVLTLTVLALFSAVARRLHDRDRTGLWGLLPLPFAALGVALIPYAFSGIREAGPPPPVFFALMLNNLVYMAALIGLIVLLVGKGSEGPNRFGPAPA